MLTQKDIKRMIDDWETEVVEFKRAKGAVPASFWESYSAFANTDGGVIVLGVAEKRYSKLMFRNPGCLRMAKEAAIGGGRSDARNSRIFNIFSLINIGERSGTGLSDIFSIWKEYGYEQPSITETYQPDQVSVVVQVEIEKGAVTFQGNAAATQEVALKVAPKNDEVAPKVAPKDGEVAPKKGEQDVCEVINSVFPVLRDGIAAKCAKMYVYMRDSGGSNSDMARELGIPLRSIIRYQEILKQALVLEHVGPTNGGTWKFLI